RRRRVVSGRRVGGYADDAAQELDLLWVVSVDPLVEVVVRAHRRHFARKFSMKRRNTRAESSASSTVIASAGLWLTPPLQRTNSIPISATSTIAMPSWPAPLGNLRTEMPSAAMAAPI